MKKKARKKQRRYYSSDGETYWALGKGTNYSFWFHARTSINGRAFPDIVATRLEIPNSLFIFDKETI